MASCCASTSNALRVLTKQLQYCSLRVSSSVSSPSIPTVRAIPCLAVTTSRNLSFISQHQESAGITTIRFSSQHFFSSGSGSDDGTKTVNSNTPLSPSTKDDSATDEAATSSSPSTTSTMNNQELSLSSSSPEEIMASFEDTSYYDLPLQRTDYSNMTNEELMDTSKIPGWELIYSPPKDPLNSIPRGSLVGTVVSTKMQKNY